MNVWQQLSIWPCGVSDQRRALKSCRYIISVERTFRSSENQCVNWCSQFTSNIWMHLTMTEGTIILACMLQEIKCILVFDHYYSVYTECKRTDFNIYLSSFSKLTCWLLGIITIIFSFRSEFTCELQLIVCTLFKVINMPHMCNASHISKDANTSIKCLTRNG